MALNEANSRAINEGIERSHVEAGRNGYVRMLCECSEQDCGRVVAMTVQEYEHVRQNARRFAVAKGHVAHDIESIVDETDRFVVIEKSEGVPAAIAEGTDTRA